MKPNMQRNGNTSEVPSRRVVRTSEVKKGTNRQRGPQQKASGVLPFSATEVLSRQLPTSEPSMETKKEAATMEPKNRQIDPLTKIKLQLFPVDEVTRIGLENDGLNPFLELTLRARKKISSVIKHIQTKWGSSSIAIGEPMLLPYDAQLRNPIMSKRWTSNDTVISAGDVYTAVESPAIFRLSYGWFSDHDPQRVSTATADSHNFIESESMQKQIESTVERKYFDVIGTTEVAVTDHVDNDMKTWGDNATNLQPFSISTEISIGGLLSEASLQGNLCNNEQAPIQWDDGLTALSIGGLLSEASLQAKIKKSDSSAFISDSFDAVIASQTKNNPQVAKPFDAHLSILDAEETCHAFSFRKFSSSSKNVRVSTRASQDSTSNPFRFPHLPQIDKHAVNAEDASCQELKMELFPRPQQYSEDSRSLGLRGITWNESLGPFDLGVTRKASGGNNV